MRTVTIVGAQKFYRFHEMLFRARAGGAAEISRHFGTQKADDSFSSILGKEIVAETDKKICVLPDSPQPGASSDNSPLRVVRIDKRDDALQIFLRHIAGGDRRQMRFSG